MRLRKLARKYGREVQCHRNLLKSRPVPGRKLAQVLGQFDDQNKRRSLMLWLTKHGPFWDEPPKHSSDDYFEVNGDVVTDTAAGEAAYRNWSGAESGLVSFRPSRWNATPILVNWHHSSDGLEDRQISLSNWWEEGSFETWLEGNVPPPKTWDELRAIAPARFPKLVFGQSCFAAMKGMPIAQCSINRCMELLRILNQLADAFDCNGKRTSEGNDLHQRYFTGGNDFSDSSDSEKDKFVKALTFIHPSQPGKSVVCPWHGKIRHQTLRMHFTWPIISDEPVYIVYVGPKLTKV